MQIVEEFMSIADGQVVLQPPLLRSAPAAGSGSSSMGRVPLETNVDPRASISRIGSRAHPAALATLAPELRFNLAQVRICAIEIKLATWVFVELQDCHARSKRSFSLGFDHFFPVF